MKTVKYTIMMLLCLCCGFIFGIKSAPGYNDCMVSVSADTLWVHDTIFRDRPVPVEIRRIDTLLVEVSDTVMLHDTAYVMLPTERRVYCDSTFRAVISGYRPVLDTIAVYPVSRHITTVKTVEVPCRKRWGIGVQAGYGMYLDSGRPGFAPYVGIGVSYNFLSF